MLIEFSDSSPLEASSMSVTFPSVGCDNYKSTCSIYFCDVQTYPNEGSYFPISNLNTVLLLSMLIVLNGNQYAATISALNRCVISTSYTLFFVSLSFFHELNSFSISFCRWTFRNRSFK